MADTSRAYKLRRYEIIASEEAERVLAYDDATGKTVTDPAKKVGFITVGVGFNMDRPDARTVFARAVPGVSFDLVYGGKLALTRPQMQSLFDYTVQEAESVVSQKFTGVRLTDDQRIALVSMAFNRPAHRGPQLPAPRKAGARGADAPPRRPGGRLARCGA